MAKKIQDDDGNTYVAVKPWYKKWWVWVIIVVVVIFVLALLGGGGDDDSSDTSTSKATAKKTDTSEKAATSSSKLTLDYEDYDVSKTKTYSVNYSDTSWNAGSVKVDKVTVYKLTKPYKYESANDGTFKANGFVRLHFTVNAKRDISMYPTQGTVSYSNGEQHEADSLESWDGDISKGVTKSGNVTLPIKSLDSVTSLKNLRYKFTGDYDTDDYEDDNADKDFDITINLNN